MAHVGEKVQFCPGVLFQLTAQFHKFGVEPSGIGIAPVGLGGYHDKQDCKGNNHPHYDSLGVVLEEEGIQFAAEVLNHSALLCNLLFLHLEHSGVVAVHEGAFQKSFPLEGLSCEDVHRKLHHQVSAGRVKIGCRQDSVNDVLKTGIREGVNPKEGNVRWTPEGFARSDCHAVILAKDGIGAHTLRHQGFHGFPASLFQPSAIRRCQQGDSGIAIKCLLEAPVAVIGRG